MLASQPAILDFILRITKNFQQQMQGLIFSAERKIEQQRIGNVDQAYLVLHKRELAQEV